MGSYWSSTTTNNNVEFDELITKVCEASIKAGQLETLISTENMPPNKIILLKKVLQDKGFDLEEKLPNLEISGWAKKPTPGSQKMIEQFKKLHREVLYGTRLEQLQKQFKAYAGTFGHDMYFDKNIGTVYGEEVSGLLQNLGYDSVYEPENNWIVTKWTDRPIPSPVDQELRKLLKDFENDNDTKEAVETLFQTIKKNVENHTSDAWVTLMVKSQGIARIVIKKFQQLPDYDIKPYGYYQVYEAAKTGDVPPEKVEDKQPYYIHGVCVSKK